MSFDKTDAKQVKFSCLFMLNSTSLLLTTHSALKKDSSTTSRKPTTAESALLYPFPMTESDDGEHCKQ
jgi:hypothetical protein